MYHCKFNLMLSQKKIQQYNPRSYTGCPRWMGPVQDTHSPLKLENLQLKNNQ